MGPVATGSSVPERELMDAARAGDEDAFRRLVEPHHAALHAHCYRMMASVHDAEDALQDTLLRAWRGLPGLEDATKLRRWLYTIATNACLDALARRRKRVLPIDYGPATGRGEEPGEPLAESVWVQAYPDEEIGVEDGREAPEARYERRESIELAFIAALQHLAPRQRAVLILREVLGFSAREVAQALGTTTTSVNSALQRARKSVEERLPEQSQQATLRSLGDAGIRDLVERFTDAFETGDVEAILGLLAEDATFAMPPYEGWCRGRDAIADSWLIPEPAGGLRYVETRANGQLALGTYRFSEAGSYVPIALDVLTLRGARISDVQVFRTPDAFRLFGLPGELPA
jgi:RNA polymerase sigma-70 factor, ECF subfamily